jgi:hypothetical protein
VKLPNILGVDARPFDPDTFDAGAEVEVDERGFQRVRLRDLNCIRRVHAGARVGRQERLPQATTHEEQ